jgi:hypothetical protein
MSGPSRRHALLGVLLLASAAFLLYSLRSGRPRVRAGDGPAVEVATDSDEEEIAAAPAAVPDDVDFSRYEALAKTNVFSRRRSTPPQQAKKLLPAPPPIKPSKPAVAGAKRPDFTGWTYTGYIVIDGEKRGILQNESSDSCKDVPVGGKFLGATVEEVTGERMRLRSGASTITLSIPDLFPVLPLDKGASGEAPSRPRPR